MAYSSSKAILGKPSQSVLPAGRPSVECLHLWGLLIGIPPSVPSATATRNEIPTQRRPRGSWLTGNQKGGWSRNADLRVVHSEIITEVLVVKDLFLKIAHKEPEGKANLNKKKKKAKAKQKPRKLSMFKKGLRRTFELRTSPTLSSPLSSGLYSLVVSLLFGSFVKVIVELGMVFFFINRYRWTNLKMWTLRSLVLLQDLPFPVYQGTKPMLISKINCSFNCCSSR